MSSKMQPVASPPSPLDIPLEALPIFTAVESVQGTAALIMWDPINNQAGVVDYTISTSTADDCIVKAITQAYIYLYDYHMKRPKRLTTFSAENVKYASPSHMRHTPLTQRSPTTPSAYSAAQVERYIPIRLSNTAWSHISSQTDEYEYNGKVTGLGALAYIKALLNANPTSTHELREEHWTDTRPDNVKMLDTFRLQQQRFPAWSFAYISGGVNSHTRRKPRLLPRDQFALTLPPLLALADHFIIASSTGDQTDPSSRAAAVLEAIGLRWLTPTMPPRHNPRPVNNKRSLRREEWRKIKGNPDKGNNW